MLLIVVHVLQPILLTIIRACQQPGILEPTFVVRSVDRIIVEPCPCRLVLPVFLELCPGHVLAVVLHDVGGLHVFAPCHEGLLLPAFVDVVAGQRPHLVAVQTLVGLVDSFVAADPPAAGALLLADHHPDGIYEVQFLIFCELFDCLHAFQQIFLAFIPQKFSNKLLEVSDLQVMEIELEILQNIACLRLEFSNHR